MAESTRPKQIKILLPSGDHDCVRVAAALRRVPMAEFCRQMVVTEATHLTAGLDLLAQNRQAMQGKQPAHTPTTKEKT